MDGMIEGRVTYYRREGRWHFCIYGPSWVISDIAKEEHKEGSHLHVENFGGGFETTNSILVSVMNKETEDARKELYRKRVEPVNLAEEERKWLKPDLHKGDMEPLPEDKLFRDKENNNDSSK